MIRRSVTFATLLALAACGAADGDEDGVGGLTAAQADALNRAAERIDVRSAMADADARAEKP